MMIVPIGAPLAVLFVFIVLHQIEPLVYSADAVARFGEPTRLSSDRSPGDGNAISVRVLHEAQTPGTYRRGEQRTRSFLDRGIMMQLGPAFVLYTITRPGRPELRGIVGSVDLHESVIYGHEDVIPSAVAARLADIERAGAMLEPVVVAADGLDIPETHIADSIVRTVHYGDEIHTVSIVESRSRDQILAPQGNAFVVLDGHHRIAAVNQQASDLGSTPSVLAMVVHSDASGLFVEPQHRVLSGPPVDIDAIPSELRVLPYQRNEPVGPGSVALVTGRSGVVIAAPKSSRPHEGRISALTLHRHLIEPLAQRVEGYATRESDAYAQLESGASAVAIMGDLDIADVTATARRGIILPEKTTCFNPKVAVGLVGSASAH